MDLGISGRTALVTGASRGIGLAIAQTLASEGVRVVGAARTVTPELERVAAAAVSVDLSTRDGARSIVDRTLAVVDGIDFLVNLPGLRAGASCLGRGLGRGSAVRGASGCVDGCPAGPRGGGGCL
jgi:NAD(P)-dependent dehydrogenase (short-subunit alcohol dehydrogenase family)